eukprot:403332395
MIVCKKTVIQALSLLLFTLALYTSLADAQSKPTCMYCKRADADATLLVSYSYCSSSDTCLQDRWMYIDRPCTSGWVGGKNIQLSTCSPSLATCHSFVSNEQAAGQQVNHTETLSSGEYCQISVDATSFLARVVLDDALTLGVDMDYNVGDVYLVKQGEKKTITVFNGDTSGAITFTLAFSQAMQQVINNIFVLAASSASLLLLSTNL